MIETKRLKLFVSSREEMEKAIAAQTDEGLKAAYHEMLGGCLAHPDEWEWYAVWRIETKDGRQVGEFCFKGVDSSGSTEIGYGIGEAYRGLGYATEAVEAAAGWAFRKEGIAGVTAEVDRDNRASIRVLEKAGFIPTGEIGEEGPVYRKENPAKKQRKFGKNNVTIRPETHGDYRKIVSLVLRSFKEGTDYSDGTDIVALIEEIRDSEFYLPELAFVAEAENEIVGHFLFSRFPLSQTPEGGHGGAKDTELVMLAPVSVHADHLRTGIGSAMLRLGIEKVREAGFRGIIVEGNYRFYNTLGFVTSSEYGIYPVSGYPLTDPRCQMCMETFPGSLKNRGGFVVYDMYFNA